MRRLRNLVPGSGKMRALYGRLRAIAVALGLLLAMAAANAQSFDEALSVGIADGRIKRGNLVLLEAMGGGFTWGATLLRW